MTINDDVLYDTFSWSRELYDIAYGILERMETNDDDELYYAMDSELIWTHTQWTIMMEYQSPQDANWESAIEEFTNDLMSAISNGALVEEE